ncbi:thioredoxin [Candidatus Annandia pinicola]|uniref:thioredoxin n=1 Tax=Candidatus Annandia pinicola TaxID=1345117 RepID=UPI001D0087B8|nr:thioredoxin [Candidatus Annandia pinicola]UDG80467.1 Thioredoxin [Candidatus Annandia pinicola]
MSNKNSNIINITNNNLDKILKKSKKLLLIDFWATWCNPCKLLSPIINEISYKYIKKIEVYKINIDENKDTVSKYNIKTIPTIFFFRNNKLLYKIYGIQTKSNICSLIDKHLKLFSNI